MIVTVNGLVVMEVTQMLRMMANHSSSFLQIAIMKKRVTMWTTAKHTVLVFLHKNRWFGIQYLILINTL